MYFNGSGGTGINFTVTCSKAGNYPLTIRYLIPSGWGDKQNDVLVNGSLDMVAQFYKYQQHLGQFRVRKYIAECRLQHCSYPA